MKRMTILLLCCTIAIGSIARQYHIIPQPKEITDKEGTFTLTAQTKIYAHGDKNLKVAQFFADKLSRLPGLKLTTTKKQKGAQIKLLISKKIVGDEAYRLTVSADGVVAEAKTDRGLFYAMQTFLQLLPPEVEGEIKTTSGNSIVPREGWVAPAVVINDEPRFSYRSFMLDPCRHFLTISEIKKQIDIMSMYKANNFHLHLTEDQGWRVQIKKYPRLTEVGSVAIGLPDTPDGSSGESRYYYTQDELRDLVAYAEERFINIIPEFEMPGHGLAAIAAYPWLSCRSLDVKPRTTWGVEPIIMCAGKESTFQFLQDVVDELVDIFPSKYFHIGGDEAPRNEWKTCPLCQKRADSLGFTTENGRSREAQLQSYLVNRMEKYLNAKGRTIIGWDEILEGGGLNKEAVVMSWRGTKGGIEAAKAGHKAIMSPSSDGYYLDYYEGDRTIEPVAPTYAASVPLSKTYNYEPIAPELEGDLEKYILGPQGNLWGEYLPDVSTLEFRFYPRILAIMETGWTQRKNRNFEDFCRRLDSDSYQRLAAHRVLYNIPAPLQDNGQCNFVAFTNEAVLSFHNDRNEPMRYTLDGGEPTLTSPLYEQPIRINDDAILKIATILPSGLKSETRNITLNKQELMPSIMVGEALTEGLALSVADGLYSNISDLATANFVTAEGNEGIALEKLPHLNRNGHYSAIAEGLIDVPEDGVWFFRANYPEVWVDGAKVVDNTDHWVLDGMRGGRSMALQKGLHYIKVVFLGYNASGRPTYWDHGQIQWRHQDAKQYSKITNEVLRHAAQ